MSKFNKALCLLVVVVASAFAYNHLKLIDLTAKTMDENEHQERYILFYQNRHELDQATNKGLGDENRKLHSYNNFLESQNAMLMEKESEVIE